MTRMLLHDMDDDVEMISQSAYHSDDDLQTGTTRQDMQSCTTV